MNIERESIASHARNKYDVVFEAKNICKKDTLKIFIKNFIKFEEYFMTL